MDSSIDLYCENGVFVNVLLYSRITLDTGGGNAIKAQKWCLGQVVMVLSIDGN